MARPSETLIQAIRRAANKIENGSDYQWGHMGACNCGHLAQELTSLNKGEIHQTAMKGYGDWSQQILAFCPTSNMSMDLLISELITAGLSLEDLIHLERLSDRNVLLNIPGDKRSSLKHNNARDVALYMNTWADFLNAKMVHHKSESLITIS